MPALLHRVEPVYPAFAREEGVDGKVVLQVLIGTDGRVKKTRVVQSIPMLDAAAVEAVRQWTFRPVLNAKGKPIEAWVKIPVTFSIQRSPPPDSAHAVFDRALNELHGTIRPEYQEAPRAPSERDTEIREHVIRLGLVLTPPLAIPVDLGRSVQAAQAALDSATAGSQERALDMLVWALYRAPWFADAYLVTARALEALGRPADAAVALHLYLVAAPTTSRRQELEKKIEELRSSAAH